MALHQSQAKAIAEQPWIDLIAPVPVFAKHLTGGLLLIQREDASTSIGSPPQ